MTPARAKSATLDEQLESELSAKHPAAKELTVPPGEGTTRGFGEPMPAGGGEPTTRAIIFTAQEAIIRTDFTRPALIVRNNTFEMPQAGVWRSQLIPHKMKLERAIRSTGRVELTNHPSYPWAGTAWMVTERVAVTNRHVAMIFARRKGASFPMIKAPNGAQITARVDFREEHKVGESAEFPIERVLFIEEDADSRPDLALVEFKKGTVLPEPIALLTKAPEAGQVVAVIGYPANDPRNPASAVSGVFGDVFDVKRLAPGKVISNVAGFVFTHDCSTLGGNSGSVVIDVETGRALGLHFGGRFKEANYAVEAREIEKRLKALKVTVPVTAAIAAAEPAKKKPKGPSAADLAGRTGFETAFLGAAKKHQVKLPKITADAPGTPARLKGSAETVLHYTHFSIVMNKERRFAFYTACNIDGNSLKRFSRADAWFLDPRLPEGDQAGEELYRNNELDRGHLVRRLDPVWGDEETARQADADTFFFTNATPQHAQFNQKTWLSLEDYILGNAGVHGLRISVFTGPVFGAGDRIYRGVRLPEQYWKVVAMVRDTAKRRLSATAYMLSQRDLLSTLEFAFGQFRTYQVPVAKVQELTGLDFQGLAKFDPLGKIEGPGAVRELASPDQIVF
jgi:endonuclease G